MVRLKKTFYAKDGPTLVVALCIYTAWFSLLWWHAFIPWWLMMPCGAYVIAWHFSLQHEAIHAFAGIPAWLRLLVVFPPLGLWFPFPLYRKSHRTHHKDTDLTVPGRDTESYYVKQQDWPRLPVLMRVLLQVNQTLLGRLTLGPLLRLYTLVKREYQRIRSGDFSHAPHWLVHAAAVSGVLWFAKGVCHMPITTYIGLVAYPGMSLGLLRAFTEHKAADDYRERTAAVESNALFSCLYLYNNLHVVHHVHPTMPWYEISRYYKSNRERLLADNGVFVYRGYWQIVRRFFVRSVFAPRHPFI